METVEQRSGSAARRGTTTQVPWVFIAVFVVLALLVGAFELGRHTAPSPPPVLATPPAGATMPNLVGMTAQNAASMMAGTLGIASVGVAGLSNPDEIITSQNPAEGTPITPSTKVTLYTSAAGSSAQAPATSETPAPSSTPPPLVDAVPAPAADSFTYTVTGPTSASSISYTTEGGGQAQANGAQLPWSQTVRSPGPAGVATPVVTAQNAGDGTIACQITGPNGVVVAQNSAEGPFGVVTCTGHS